MDKLSVAHSTAGKAFTTTLRSKFTGAKELFIWNVSSHNQPPQSLDLLLVDEAHRVRESNNTRFTRKDRRSLRSQTAELIESAKVTVFFLDENQYVRPDEIGCTQLFRDEAQRLGIRPTEYDLDVQFRCGGCTEYTAWVDYLLGFTNDKPKPWGQMYRLKLVDSTADLDAMLRRAKEAGERARIVAGFCWPWSDPLEDGSLIDDVQIGNWSRPWNAKALEKKSYTPKNHPYTLWAETEAGEDQIGAIYSIQGFEFDRVGVIWGLDVVWEGAWVANKNATHDKPVKRMKDNILRLQLLRNAYRVLLTRGMKETYLLCLDKGTRDHVRELLRGMQSEREESEI